MALERKPAEPGAAPEYPDAEAYAADRRKFLGTIGALAVGAAGLWALRRMGPLSAEDGPPPPKLRGEPGPPPAPPPRTAGLPPPVRPPAPKENAPAGNTPPAEPAASPKGGIRPPRAEPAAEIQGKIRAVEPVAPSRGTVPEPVRDAEPAKE